MDARIPKKSVFKFFLLSIITLGIYAIVFWHKLGRNVNALCEGDGKKTMKYGFAFFLSVITFGIYGIIWKVKLAERLKVNAERYELMIPEGGTEIALFSTLGLIALGAGIPISSFIIIKNYNMIANAFNAYNDLPEPEEEYVDLFREDEVLDLDAEE
ncbi:MAG: DUF4234 domain-containing protein [Clostridia bacterium]|nr:DUF4234 domain-containing protein [Clostridia bacterium]